MPPTIRTPAEGRTIAVVGDVYRFLATGEDTNGKYAMWEAVVPPGGGPPPHVHSREEEGFYVLEGEIKLTVGGTQSSPGPPVRPCERSSGSWDRFEGKSDGTELGRQGGAGDRSRDVYFST